VGNLRQHSREVERPNTADSKRLRFCSVLFHFGFVIFDNQFTSDLACWWFARKNSGDWPPESHAQLWKLGHAHNLVY